MRYCVLTMTVAGLLAGTAVALGQAGQTPPPTTRTMAGQLILMPTRQYQNQYADMEQQLDLTDDQKSKVKEAVDAMNQELDDYQQNAMEEMRMPMPGGRANGGPAGRGQAMAFRADQMLSKRVELQQLIDAHELKIDGLLTAEQRVTWDTYRLNQLVENRTAVLGLTDDQKEKVRAEVESAGKSLAGVSDAKEVPVMEGKLLKKIVGEILTEEQASRFLTMGAGPMTGFGPMRRPPASAAPQN